MLIITAKDNSQWRHKTEFDNNLYGAVLQKDFLHEVQITVSFYGRPTGQAIIFCRCGFLLSVFLVSSPIISGHRLDVYHTSAHDVIV